MKILLLTTDAFGGHGGIAQYNRDLLSALAAMTEVEEIVAIPRYIPRPVEDLPPRLTYLSEGAGGKLRYVQTVLKALRGKYDLVICGHINLLSLAWLSAIKLRAPLALMVYGIDVWQPHRSVLVRMLLRQVEAVWSISEFTRDKMVAWSKIAAGKFCILPNAIALEHYGMAAKDASLIKRYGLGGRKVMMLLARLVGTDRYKGVDELIELMPELLAYEPKLIFLVAGDGDDRPRLEAKAKTAGIFEHVRFTGFVPESEKSAHFRLADAFVMPSRCEGFGFVFLEAMACGIPVVASCTDGGREAVRLGKLGQMVNPDDCAVLLGAIIKAMNSEKGIPEGLDFFSFANFQSRLRALVIAMGSR